MRPSSLSRRTPTAAGPPSLSRFPTMTRPDSRLRLQPQQLASGVDVVIAPSDPEQASTALAAIGDRLPTAVEEHGGGFLDCGRWSPVTATKSVLSRCDLVVMVTDPSVPSIEH